MVKMTLLTGPYAGVTRDVTNQNPRELLGSVYAHGWEWEIDYSVASEEETLAWGGQDMALRCVRALQHGRTVTFLGKKYNEFSEEVVGELEDAIVNSNRMVKIVRDDDTGVIIEAFGYESH